MPSALIIGAGPNIGLTAAKTFASAGYKVAIASRNPPPALNTEIKHYVFNGANPETIPALFQKVASELGSPSVVIYNVAKRTILEHPFQLNLEEFRTDMDANTTSTYVAAQEAVKGFAKNGTGGTFIFTGNKLVVLGKPEVLVFGMGKSASAHLIRSASTAYEGKGYKFYYVDQRQKDGNITAPPGGEAHAKLFLELAQDPKQRAWKYTFVDGQGYTDFHEE